MTLPTEIDINITMTLGRIIRSLFSLRPVESVVVQVSILVVVVRTMTEANLAA